MSRLAIGIIWALSGIAEFRAIAQNGPAYADAIVTDSDGRVVSGLKLSDFTLVQAAGPREITGCSFIDTHHSVIDPSNLVLFPGPIRAAQVRRIVLIVDDLNLSVEESRNVRKALRQLSNEQMQTGDEAAIALTSAGSGSLEQFTSDKRVLNALIDRVRSRQFGDGESEARFSVGTLDMVRAVLDGLRGVPGRKSVVVFTAMARARRTAGDLPSLLQIAHRAFVVFYAIDVRGRPTTFTADRAGRVPVLIAAPPDELPGSVLPNLAKETGGVIFDHGDVSSALGRVLKDQDGYYLIQYRRGTGPQTPVSNVTVGVTRPGLLVRSRNGFVPTPDELQLDRLATLSEQLANALRTPFSVGDIRLSLRTLFFHTAQDGPHLTVLLHLDARDLVWVKALNGSYVCGFDLMIAAFRDDGQAAETRGRMVSLQMTEAEHQEAIRDGLHYELRFPVSRPGSYQLHVALSDTMSGRLGSGHEFIETPDVGRGDLSLSGIILTRTPEDPAGALNTRPPAADPNHDEGIMLFKPGDSLTFRYGIYNLSKGEDNRAEVESQVQVIHDFERVSNGGPDTVTFGSSPDPAHRAIAGRVALNTQLPAGDYILEVIVTDKLAKGATPRVAKQHVFFELRPQ